MNRGEAAKCVQRICDSMDDARAALLDLYEREGWRALGYASWRECVTAEFQQSQSYLYRELTAARIEREFSPKGEMTPLPERHARELAPLSADERRAVVAEVTATGQPLTAARIAAVVLRRAAERADPVAVLRNGEAAINDAEAADERADAVAEVLRLLARAVNRCAYIDGARAAAVLRLIQEAAAAAAKL